MFHTCGDIVGRRPSCLQLFSCGFSLHKAGENIWRIGANGCSLLLKLFLKCFHYCISIAYKVYNNPVGFCQRVSNTYSALANRSPTTRRYIFPVCLHINGLFLLIFFKVQFSSSHLLKIQAKKLKIINSSSPIFSLSNCTTFAKLKVVRQSL